MNLTTSTLATLSADEKATVLDQLLAGRPDLRKLAETYAVSLLSDEDRSAVADDVEEALQGWDIEELNSRAGRQPDGGEPMRETRYRAAQRRTPRSRARMGRHAALTLRG